MPTASKKPTRAADEILPQLGNCDMTANHWAKELLTIFECTCVKEWRDNQHLKARIGLWENGQQWRYSRHLKLASDKVNREFPLIISSSEDILTDEDKILDPDTLIFISKANANKATLSWWAGKNPVCIIEKYDEKSFVLRSDYREERILYRRFREGEIRNFTAKNLAEQGLRKTRSKGTKNSNKNSAAQSARKKGKLVKGSAVRLTGADINTIETMTDAHKIVSAEYGYEKSYRQFARDVKKSEIKLEKAGKVLNVSLIEI